MAKDPQIKAIEDEAYRRSLADDGKSSKKERFRLRNELRAQAGLPSEKKKRGGIAGIYDRNKHVIKPLAAAGLGLATGGLLAPVAAGALMGGLDREGKGGIGFDFGGAARGGLEGGLAGGIGKFAGTLLPSAGAAAAPLPMGATGGIGGIGSMGANAATQMAGALQPVAASGGGLLGGAAGFLNSPTMQTLGKLGAGAYGIYQQNKGQQLANDAMKADQARWGAGAPLREAGMQGLLNPMPASDLSGLAALSSQGNPFAQRPNPVPGAGTLAGNAAEERPGLQKAPMSSQRGR